MARYLLDTDAVIDYLFGIPGTVSVIERLQRQGDMLCVCSVVMAEIYSGLRPQHRDTGEQLLNACEFLPTGPEAATQAGTWRYDYARRGIVLSTTDVLVAATAHANAATIVTRNTDHYPMAESSLEALPRPSR